MEYLTLNNGMKMPMVGFGTWDVRGKEGESIILDAIETGYRLLDTAQMYDNEKMVGNAIKESNINRKELFITTKLHRPNSSYMKAKMGIEKSLNELQLDYIDMILIHEPYAESFHMYKALKEALEEGKVKAIGISNFNKKHYEEFISSCGVIPVINQVESHVYFPQLKLQKEMESRGTHMQAWSPFTQGKKNIFAEEILNSIGANHGKTSAQIALKYLVQNNISVVPKSSNKNRMKDNLDIFDFELTYDEMKDIEGLNTGKSLFGWYGDSWI